jgi:hypothetical protein
MPESSRKRSAPATKAAQSTDDAVKAKPVKAKIVEAMAVAAEAPKAAKATKKAAKAAQPAQPADVLPSAEPAKKATKVAAKTAKKAPDAPVEPTAEVPAPEPDTDADEPGFLNRAARRAKGGKGNALQPVSGKGPKFAGRGAVPGQRQWGTRRTGG